MCGGFVDYYSTHCLRLAGGWLVRCIGTALLCSAPPTQTYRMRTTHPDFACAQKKPVRTRATSLNTRDSQQSKAEPSTHASRTTTDDDDIAESHHTLEKPDTHTNRSNTETMCTAHIERHENLTLDSHSCVAVHI